MKLEIKNLSKKYPNGVQDLRDVNLSIEKGMFGLLGQNGSGKSTLMRTIATLQNADAGSINFEGIDVFKNPDKLRRLLGYLPLRKIFTTPKLVQVVEALDSKKQELQQDITSQSSRNQRDLELTVRRRNTIPRVDLLALLLAVPGRI